MIVFLDSNIVIYAVENPPVFGAMALARLGVLRSAGDRFMVSDLTRMECLLVALIDAAGAPGRLDPEGDDVMVRPRRDCPMPATTDRITKTPGVCGGEACIRGHRIPVWVLVGYRRLGKSEADLLRDYPSLTAADLQAAWEYAASHPEEIDRAIRENEEGEEGPVE